MAKRNTPPMRVDPKFKKMIDDVLDRRITNKLITRKEANYPEVSRLLMRMPEMKICLDKLAKLPKKEDIRWELP